MAQDAETQVPEEWHDAETLQRRLGISRRTFYRWVESGQVEAGTLGGAKVYRAVLTLPGREPPSSPKRSARAAPRDTAGSGTGGTDGTGVAVLGLVERFSLQVDELHRELQRLTGEVERHKARADRAEVELSALRHQVEAQSSGGWLRRGLRAALGG